jgi:hypothetical protein
VFQTREKNFERPWKEDVVAYFKELFWREGQEI